jgi:hypothetical protein
MGYQIGFPWSLGVGINFSYTTPNILLDTQQVPGTALSIITPNLFPGVSISADLGNGPGARHRDRCGRWCAAASVRSAHLQGRKSGCVTTYSEPWNMN